MKEKLIGFAVFVAGSALFITYIIKDYFREYRKISQDKLRFKSK